MNFQEALGSRVHQSYIMGQDPKNIDAIFRRNQVGSVVFNRGSSSQSQEIRRTMNQPMSSVDAKKSYIVTPYQDFNTIMTNGQIPLQTMQTAAVQMERIEVPYEVVKYVDKRVEVAYEVIKYVGKVVEKVVTDDRRGIPNQ